MNLFKTAIAIDKPGTARKLKLVKPAVVLFLCSVCVSGNADQLLLANVNEAEKIFWEKVYPGSHYTLYCGEQFNSKTKDLSIERVYPTQWTVNYLGCSSVEQCRNESRRFNRIEADLHNYYPALTMIVRARSDFPYGEVAGEFREFFECDFEQDVRNEVIEARNRALGNIARSLFYMHWEYGLPLRNHSLKKLIRWHNDDPPSNDERRRNDIIEKLQGTRNSFIDEPEKANKLR